MRDGSVASLPGPVVLHVVEAWGGGVASAIYDYISSTPEWSHVLLATRRTKHDTRELDGHKNLTFRDLPAGKLAALATIAREYQLWQPTVVHAHSSFAGVLTRMSPAVPRDRIVYTPHCYAFERLDLSAPLRAALRLIEKTFAPATGAVAACSPREAELARSLLGARRSADRGPDAVTYVPNVVRLRAPQLTAPADQAGQPGRLRVAAVGRLSAQKDPDFYLAVVRAARAIEPDIHWQWLGGDPPEQVERLKAEGVDVTGWLPRETVLSELAKADVYLHTAAWEGAPVAVLEAAALDVPIVARRIPALTSLSLERLGDSPEDVAALLLGLLEPAQRATAHAECVAITARHDPSRQQVALRRVYAAIAARNASDDVVAASVVAPHAPSEAGSEA